MPQSSELSFRKWVCYTLILSNSETINSFSIKAATRPIHITAVRFVNPKWREDRNLPAKLNECGPLTNRPDYTFMDGRPTPLGVSCLNLVDLYGSKGVINCLWNHYFQVRALTRLTKQRELAQKIVTSCAELNFAKERYQRLLQEKESEKQRIIGEKFKPKGNRLLEKKKWMCL